MAPAARNRALLSSLVALAFLALAVEFALHPRPSRDAEPRWPSPPEAAMPVPSGAPEGEADADVAGLEALLNDVFGETKAPLPPVARSFAREFMSRPALRAAYERYRREEPAPGAPLDAPRVAAFGGELGRQPEFHRLVSRFLQDPGFRAATLRFLDAPSIRALVAAPAGRGRAAGGSTSAVAAWLRSGPGALADRGQIGFQARGAGSGSDNGGSVPSIGADVAALSSGPAPSGNWRAPQNDAAQAAAATTPMAATPNTGAEQTLGIASFCFRQTDSSVLQHCQEIEKYLGRYGIWGACYKAGQYDWCRQMCLTQPELNCGGSVPNYYDACTQVDSAATCASNCASRTDCVVPNGSGTNDPASQNLDPTTICASLCQDPGDESCRSCMRNPAPYAAVYKCIQQYGDGTPGFYKCTGLTPPSSSSTGPVGPQGPVGPSPSPTPSPSPGPAPVPSSP